MSGGPAETPRISVIIPAWNAAASIETAIGSVVSQDEPGLECVVVDDGSTDDTGSLIEAAAVRDPRVVPVRLPANEGASAARNRALDVSRGEWLLFLDADDRLLPGAVGALIDAATANDALIAVGQRVSTDGERTWIPTLYDMPDIREPGRKSIARNPGLLYYAGPAGKLIHRSCTTGLRFEGRVVGDQPWVLRSMLRAGDRIVVITDDVYEWRRPHPDHYVATITSSRERSARLAADAVAMAAQAFTVVSAEMQRTLDPGALPIARRTYLERLIRADLAVQLSRAVKRADPDLGELFRAMTAFLAAAPPSLLVGMEALARNVLTPPLQAWDLMPRSERGAYWQMAMFAVNIDPTVIARIPGRSRRIAVRVARLPLIGQAAAALVVSAGLRRAGGPSGDELSTTGAIGQ